MRERINPRQQLIWKIPLWSADGKAVRRPPCQSLLGIYTRSLAPLINSESQLRNSWFLGSLSGFRFRAPASLKPANHLNLELAKGFEPLTL